MEVVGTSEPIPMPVAEREAAKKRATNATLKRARTSAVKHAQLWDLQQQQFYYKKKALHYIILLRGWHAMTNQLLSPFGPEATVGEFITLCFTFQTNLTNQPGAYTCSETQSRMNIRR